MSEIERLAAAVGLSDEQRELLASLLAEEGIDLGGEPPIVPLRGEGELPLSFAQQRLWFLQRLEPESPFYNIAVEVRLAGDLDLAVLGRALAEVVRRHETLRTTFVEDGGEPRLKVSAPGPVPLPMADLGGLPAAEAARAAAGLIQAESRRGFDFSEAGLMRVLLLRLSPREHRALLTLHHTIADGWSMGLMVREVGALYAAFQSGVPSPLPELPFQYSDFAAWQRGWLQGEVLEKELAYWRAKLTGAEPVLDLPLDHPRPATRSSRGARRTVVLPPALVAGIDRLGRREGASLFMTLLAGYLALLGRYTGQSDLVVGYPVANRDRSDIEGLIGLFVNALVLRVGLSGGPTVRELVVRVRDEVVEAQGHSQLPFERLVEELRPERSLSYNPIFQVMFVLQNTPASELEIPGLAVDAAILDLATAQFDLSFQFERTGDALVGRMDYSTDLFEAATIERLFGHYHALLEGFAAAPPQRRLAELPMLSAAERRQLLDWGAARPAAAPETTLVALWRERVARDPGAPAASFEGPEGRESVSYGELDRRAVRLARRLRRLGVGPESRVAVLLERSLETVVAIVGVLQAGGAYVPLDPAAPEERLAFLCRDAGARALVVRGARPSALPVEAVVDLDSLTEDEDGDGAELPAVGPDHLAYVIYTSGSTGQPKGALVRHGSVARLLSETAGWFGFGPDDVWTLFHSYTFDFSVWEVWGALAHGGRLVVVPYWVSRSPEAFRHLLAAERATVLNQTPSAFRQLVRADAEAPADEPLSLRLVVFGGEALDVASLRPWFERHPEAPRLVNMYGITETTVHVTYRPVGPADLAEAHRSPIGEAIPDLSLRLLDRGLGLVPLGVTGEVCVGGPGLARGYLGRPDLTALAFVPDPFASEPGARLYRSGDLARHRPDGRLDYLGRRDAQVKVRGFRIEPGEIEAALAAHPGVRAAVVLPRREPAGGQTLVAYVAAPPGGPAAAELREALKARLPDYMVPSAFVVLEALPLTPNGKTDRRALAALPLPADRGERGEAGPGEGARTPAEELVAGIFAEVLGLARVGAGDDFFALGGHSLLATQVASRVRSVFGVELAVRAVFEAPTAAALAARLEGLAGPGTLPSIPRVPRRDSPPLSFAQQRLWFLDRLTPGSTVYNIPAAVEIAGRLDEAALEAALAEVVRRHEALRTTFREVAGEPEQVIAGRATAPLPRIDLSALPTEVREAEARRLALAEARRPFDLGRAPLLRIALLGLDDERHVALVTMHHIVSDGWSIGVLVRELGALYEAAVAGAPSPLPELAIQYADFAVWQRRHLAGARLESELAWWRGQLAGLPPALELPTDHPRPSVRSLRGATVPLAVDADTTAGAAALSRRHGTTLFMTLAAAFLALLQRYTEADDLAVGTPVAGRTRVETEPLIGFFVNTLVLRAELGDDPEVGELLARVREATLSAYAHQEVPFERLVEELAPERDPSRPPLVQVLFALQNAPQASLELPGLAITPSAVDTETARLELSCTLTETERGLEGTLEYSRDLFDAPTVARLGDHFARLLAAAVAQPQARLSALPLLSPAERDQILAEWSGRATGYPRQATIHALFAEQAALRPGAVAVAGEGEELTYGELARRSDLWARRLRARGVGLEARVALCFDRSPQRVVATLAVLAAGGAYVPLDPANPQERLEQLLRASGASVVVTEERWRSVLPPTGAEVVCLDGEGSWVENPEPLPEVPSSALAYVMYTSGSTGEPKGVAVTHRGVVRLVRETDYARFAADEVLLQIAPYTFDASTPEIWGALLNGGRLVMPPPGLLSLAQLGELLRRHGVTTLHLTAGLFNQMVEESLPALKDLRQLLTGGDVMSVAHARQAAAELPGVRLLNMYGPTENTTFTCAFHIAGPESLGATAPLGRPIANTWVYVLDGTLEPVPAGVTGELWVGGDGLARGYLGRPDLTAERFVPDPFGREPGGRLYRTGDLVRFRPTGELEFLGRADAQVKVRGFRVEPGEIEAALAAHPWVRQAVVLAEGERGADRRLVAYVAGGPGEAPQGSELRGFLRERLPDYMLPSAFVFLPALPLTANEKVDRKALARLRPERQDPAAAAAASPLGGAAPKTPAEELLAGIFAGVLKLERVGTGESFFELGGHSLLATQVVSRIQAVLGVELPVRAVFEAPTVEALARRIERAARPGEDAEPLVPVSRDEPLALSFAQQRLWFLDQLDPDSAVYNIPLAVELSGRLDVPVLAAALGEVVRRHEALRTTFRGVAGEPVQVVAPPAPFPLPSVDLQGLPRGLREAEASRLAGAEARRPFDLSRGPLLRAALLRLGSERHTVVLNVHHIVSDGWSMGVLVGELGALYAALQAGRPSPLPELAVQYADFAAWQRRHLSGELLESELAWWRGRLAGLPRALELPTDRPRPSVPGIEGAVHDVVVFRDDLAAVADLSRRHGATLFMTLLAGFLALLRRYSGQEDLAVGTPIAGRTRVETEGLIGLFVNTLSLRVDLAGDPRVGELLARVREATLAAYAHQEVPFERLVEELAPERDLSRTPLVQVMLAVQNAPAAPLELPGLALRAAGVPTGTAKFELTFNLSETEWGLEGGIEYRRDLFEPATVARLARHFTRLLADAAADPGRPLSALDPLSPAERHQLVGEWNDTVSPFPAAVLLHQFFEAAVDRAPDGLAAVCAGRELTYGELEARANRLAHRLRGAGVAPGAPVGVWIERSFDMLAAVLGVLKAGCHYVALDEGWPADRVEAILAATGAPALVTGGALLPAAEEMAPRLPVLAAVVVPGRDLDGSPAARLPAAAAPDDVAYVIHTSGSTGEPKGIVVQHRAAANLVHWVNGTFGICPEDRGLFVTSLAFDLSVWDVFGVLAAGGSVHVATREELDDPDRLVALLRGGGITVWDSAPAALVQLAPLFPAEPETSSRLRRVLLSGDWIPVTLPDRVRRAFPRAEVVALGGATEATVWSNWFPVGEVDPAWPSIPYGRPIANARYHVLEGGTSPCPVGVPGDLFIGGVCLAAGYARPDLTAQSFVPDPFAGEPGARLYRTGDRARYRADGNLEFLGRLDQQVKVRGYRIELGEIEVALARLPGVREAVVLARGEGSGDKRLVACVVPAVPAGNGPGARPDAAVLQEALRRSLPEYMVPSAFVVLADGLPTTANGKVDRKALAALAEASVRPAARFVAPRGPAEEVLAGIWAEVLGHAGPVGAADDFFALGGHSLLATQAVSRVREAFRVELPLRALFEAPTVAELAARIAQKVDQDGRAAAAPPLVPAPRGGDLPLSFSQQRLWFLDRLAPGNAFYNVYGEVRLAGELDVAALRQAFAEIVRRHESLRTTFRLAGDHPVQAIAPPPSDFPLPFVDLASVAPEAARRGEVARLSAEEAARPFDLAAGPLFRACLVRLDGREHALFLNVHHIVSDGWSQGVLFDELAALYGAFSQGLPSPLPELPIQYADFAVWQREWMQGERLEAELGYWRRQLAGLPGALELPADHPRPMVESFRGAMEPFELPAELVRPVAALARRCGATLSMAVLAGFDLLLGRLAGREDVAVGMAIANRNRRETEGLIGFFVNTLAMRVDLSGGPGFEGLLARVRETALGAYAHQDLPFERLVEELAPERDLGRNPVIQVMLGYQNYPRGAAEVRGLVLSPPAGGQTAAQTAKFDLSLFVFEEGDRLTGSLEYNSDLFEATTARRMLRHFARLLAAAAAEPGVALGLLSLLDEGERHQIALEWNDTAAAFPAAAGLGELFAAQVRRTPDAPALRFDGGEIGYAELERRAGRLARRLRALGLGPEGRVALAFERSPEMVIAVLGTVLAGAAYVPLDLAYPRERLELLMRDSGAAALVTLERWRDALPEPPLGAAAVVCLDGDGPDEPADAAAAGLPVPVPPSALAYVMYTSGSTGEPKGVAVTHRGVVRLVLETGYARFAPDEVMVQIAPYTFDASTPEIWGALLNGACLVVPPAGLLSLAELGGMLDRHGVTTLHLTAGLFNQMVDESLPSLAPLRQLLTGGDVMSVAHARRAAAELPGVRLLNMYGPTENTTFTCAYPIGGPEGVGGAGATVPLGRPIANTTVHVLDPEGMPAPLGVPGELATGGEGLARGYLGRPDLTAERFVPNPFSGTVSGSGEPAGSRLYRTGDLARRLADGRIEFLGRIDQQVKIRGYRIEPAEIESRLGEHPAVLQNVVLAREDVPGDKRLVAYVVQNPAWEPPGVETDQVSHWSELFDSFYRQGAEGTDPTFNVVGWNSSYTGQPLPRHEMAEWLEDTVGRIAALAPRRVLEIGCGTGMILFRVAPGCELYVGTDISRQALDYVESRLPEVPGIDPARLRLLETPAERLDGVEAGSLDTVILNSVAQYFPSAGYLAEVLERAVELVRPGGAVFLGDVRSKPLLPAFHASLELFQAEPETPLARLRQRVETRRLQENELTVDPAFFAALARRLPQVARVEVHPKRGRARNELTGFRYQVVLRVGGAAPEPEPVPWLDWSREGLTVAALRRRLEEERPALLGLSGVPNVRVAEAAATARLLAQAESAESVEAGTAGKLRALVAEAAAGAVDPQDLWEIPADLPHEIEPYEIELGWASPGADGRFDAVLRRRGEGTDGLPLAALLPEPRPTEGDGELAPYANDPLQGRFARRLAPELREFLKERLPDYMVPSVFVLLESMPLSQNEKVDRRRLPAPEVGAEAGRGLAAPRNATEQRLVEIWRELLGVERLGIDDDFFDLGGHSLLATQAVSRVREAFGVELPLRTFFGAGTVAAVAAEVAALRRGDDGTGEAEVPPIVPVPRDGRLPLSFAQERLWFLDRLDTRALAYNEATAFRLAGWLDEAALRWSLDEILRRHESLRTTFPEVDGEPVQAVQPPAPFEIESVDLRTLPSERREAEARDLAQAHALRPFDLARGPLVRGLLMRLADEEHAVLFSSHHIVSDGWSTGVFVRELSLLYAARVAGEPSPLPPLPVQYADFAAWQRRWLQGEVLERQLAYWRERLADAAPLDLPTDRPRPLLPQAPSGLRTAVVPPALTARLRAFSRGRGVTPFMTLLAAFQALLHRYTGQDDVAVGSPIANRNRGELEGLIGFFINMLVMRTDLSGDPAFGELVGRVRQAALGAYAHQDLPFEKLVGELRPGRDLRRTPFFQVSFQLLNVPASGLDLPGLRPLPLEVASRSAKFDLDLAFIEGGERLDGLLDYDADLFDPATMERLLVHLERLLAGALESPGTRISELPLLGAAERAQVLEEWNDTAADLPADVRLHELFERQARRSPEAVALAFEGTEMTYGELEARANRLAHVLQRWGVGPGVRVGVCLERSLEMVVALFGVLKAGGAYVPLDPSYPQDRLAFMLDDAQVPVLLAQERLLGTLPPSEARVLCLDSQWAEVEGESAEAPPPLADVDELAYVIYTSGSTGRPKGAMNTHRAIVNRLLWMQDAYGLDASDVVLQKTPMSFDVSVWEFFWPLATGARLVLARPGGHQDAGYLAGLIAAEGVTTLHFVPSMLQAFLEEPGLETSCRSLRRVIASGEALPFALQERFFARLGGIRGIELHNLYGPTEAAVDVTAWACERGSARPVVPIGRPIANIAIHLLDRDLRPVPVGVPGHLHIGGVGLARGYHRRPDLTAEKFIPDPFAKAPGGRLYATGDLARHLPDGAVEYLGRIDHQVKIRGFRIELGEVEAALASHPAVGGAVAGVHEAAGGDRRLVAWAVPDPDRAAPVRRLLQLEAEGRLAGMPRHELPNGLTVVHKNRAETDFVYREIFEDDTYLRHGVALADGDTVFDVGAHIGLFSLWAGRHARGARIYAFEPIPQLFGLMRTNAEIHGLDLTAFNAGVGESRGRARFTYYPNVGLVSGRYADAGHDREVVRSYEAGRHGAGGDQDGALLDELLAERMESEVVDCELLTLSDVLRERGIERIDLLKVDAEKSERDVLLGIAEEDWPRIRQIVAEVHDLDGRLDWMRALLEGHGFTVAVEQESPLAETDLYALYAVRPGGREGAAASSPAPEAEWSSAAALAADLRRALGDRLPEPLVPSALVLMPQLPTTPNGKVDRRALPAPEWSAEAAHVAPRTTLEARLVAIWREILGREEVGVRDDFFDLGGHSLLATRMLARLRAETGVDLPVRTLFAAPTVESLAALIAQPGAQPSGTGSRSPLVALRPGGAGIDRAPFFCVHPIGGEVLCYLDLARELPPEQPVYALQSPEPEALPSTVEEMAARYLAELRGVQPEGPYRLGGWSFGGLVAFEMARQLEREGQTVELVALIDAPAPAAEPRPAPTEEELRSAFAFDLASQEGGAGGLPEAVFQTFAANARAGCAYVRQPYTGRVALLQSEETAARDPEALDGWRRAALGGVEAAVLPGDHYSLLRRPGVERLARELAARLPGVPAPSR